MASSSAHTAASRRRPAFGLGVPSMADGSMELLPGDDDNLDATIGTCALAQVGAGCLFAFLFGSLGFILTGDATRSFLWLAGLALGATLGVFATRGASGGDAAADNDETANQAALAATACGAAAGALLYWLLLPVLALDNLMASLAAGCGAYACQGLATPHGRAQAQLAALAAARQAQTWITEVVKGATQGKAGIQQHTGGAAGGMGGGGASAGTTPPMFTGAAAFVGSNDQGLPADGPSVPHSPHV